MDPKKTPLPLLESDSAIFKEIPNDTAVTLSDLQGRAVLASCNLLNGVEGTDREGDLRERIDIQLYDVESAQFQKYAHAVKLRTRNFAGKKTGVPLEPVNLQYNPGQREIDQKLREAERKFLDSGVFRQLPNRLTPQSPTAVVIGTERHFWVLRGDQFVDVLATCKHVGESCYVFVDNAAGSATLNDQFIAQIADFFDNTAFPKDTALFAPATDTDNDPRIYLLFSQLDQGEGWETLGYFYYIDKFPSGTGPEFYYSNEHDMFYITIPKAESYLDIFKNTLAHEFQHMINFDRHWANNAPSEQTWLNEALSELAGFLCTDIGARLDLLHDFLVSPLVGLTVWNYNNSTLNLKNYAASNLFAIYLYDRFYLEGGDRTLMTRLVNNTVAGIANVTQVTGISFNELFKDWNLAMLLSDNNVTSNPVYQYKSINLRAAGLNGLYVFVVNMGNNYYGYFQPYTPYVIWIQGIGDNSFLRLLGNGAGGRLVAYWTA
jgi:hypothetical protein